MAKTSGGVRGNGRGSVPRRFTNDARSTFNNIENSYGRTYDYSAYQTKRLQSLQKLGKGYNPAEKEKAIQAYTNYAQRRTGGKFLPIGHAQLEGPRHELISVANRASAYRNLDKITAELKRRRGK